MLVNNDSTKTAIVQTWAICETSHSISYVANPRQVPADTLSRVVTECDPGSRATGGGVFPLGDAPFVLAETAPYGPVGDTPDDGWDVTVYNAGDTLQNAAFTAICYFP